LVLKLQLIIEIIKDMYGHSGTLIDGDPVVCGGWSGVACFRYERDTKMWKRVNLLKNNSI